MSKRSLRQCIEKGAIICLSPAAITRDRRLRALYEEWVAVRGTSEEPVAYAAFVKFVREEYP